MRVAAAGGHRRRLVDEQHQEAERDVEQRQHEEGVAITHHRGLAVHELRELLHRHQGGVAHALQALGEYDAATPARTRKFYRDGLSPNQLTQQSAEALRAQAAAGTTAP